MKKIIIIFLLIIVVSLFFFLKETENVAHLDSEGREITVTSTNGNVVFKYTIEEFKEWANDNWENLFEELPAFGELRDVDPNNFYRFHEGVSIYSNLLAFSVSDYAAATDISFVVVLNVKNKKIKISKPNNGSIDELLWSPDGTDIAYILHTARAVGEYISVLEVESMEKELIISGEDVDRDMPRFNNIEWKDERLYFSSHGDIWSIKDEDLRLEGSRIEGNLIINNPGIEENVWYLSYEEEGSPGMLIKLVFTEETVCDDVSFCETLLEKDDSLSGRRVEVLGVKDDNQFIVKEVK